MTMREILFRGRVDTWEHCRDYWVYGDLRHTKNPSKIRVDGEYVDPATVGQFTGSLDRNGKKIFEGDIIKVKRTQYEIVYSSGCLFAKIKKGNTTYHKIIPGLGLNDTVVIGNIHYNPELLEVLSNA